MNTDASSEEPSAEVSGHQTPARSSELGCRICVRRKRSWRSIDIQIQSKGWVVVGSHGDVNQGVAPVTYTIGLIERFKHPELILLGVPHEGAAGVLESLAEHYVRAGAAVPIDVPLAGWADSARYVAKVAIAKLEAREARRAAVRCQQITQPFSALQIIRCDAAGRLPWEAVFAEAAGAMLFGPELGDTDIVAPAPSSVTGERT